MDAEIAYQENKNDKWGLTGTLVWGILILLLFSLIQGAATVAYCYAVYGGFSDEVMKNLEYDGTAIALATFASMIVCSLVICKVIKLKESSNLMKYLAINKINRTEIIYWGFATFLLCLGIEVLMRVLNIDNSVNSEYMVTVYKSTGQPWFLFLAVVGAASVFEELFYRGFLFTGLSSTFMGSIGVTIITSLAWAAIHIQYDLYGMAMIFISGVVLAIARIKTNSILTTIMMHSIMNIVATIQVITYVP